MRYRLKSRYATERPRANDMPLWHRPDSAYFAELTSVRCATMDPYDPHMDLQDPSAPAVPGLVGRPDVVDDDSGANQWAGKTRAATWLIEEGCVADEPRER